MSDNQMNETQASPQILGHLEEPELQQLAGLRQQSEQAVYQLGKATLTMMQINKSIEVLERQAQTVLNTVGDRLGIPHGTAWSVTGDGTAILVGQPAPQTATPTPPAEGETGD